MATSLQAVPLRFESILLEVAVGTGKRWSVTPLREIQAFLASIRAHGDSTSATLDALEQIAAVLGASASAVVRAETVEALWPDDSRWDAEAIGQLAAEARGSASTAEVHGLGTFEVISTGLNIGQLLREECLLVVVRDKPPFSSEDLVMVQVMASLLELVLAQIAFECDSSSKRYEDLSAMLAERQMLLDKLSLIQRSISTHAPLQEVYEAIVQGAKDLLDVEVIGLRHIDLAAPNDVVMVASRGMSERTKRVMARQHGRTGIGGRAISEGRLIVTPEYTVAKGGLEVFVSDGVRTAMSAPIHIGGQIVGSLTVGSTSESRLYTKPEQDILLAFAEHASLALTDADTLAAVERAMHDSLTGLPNRALFFDRLNHAFATTSSRELPFGVLFIDLDEFKAINDLCGHAGGDALLFEVASRIRTCLRGSDTAARLGGDEFGVVVERVIDIDVVMATGQRIVDAVDEPFIIGGVVMKVSASVGVGLSDSAISAGEALLHRADVAMYSAKRLGGGRVVAFDPSMLGQSQLS